MFQENLGSSAYLQVLTILQFQISDINFLRPSFIYFLFVFFPPFIFISWRLITLQYCSDFCHTLTWISHGFTCVPHPDPLSHLPPHPIPLGLPSAPALNTCWDLLLKWRWDPILQVSEQIWDSTDPTCLRVCWVASVMASSLGPHEL